MPIIIGCIIGGWIAWGFITASEDRPGLPEAESKKDDSDSILKDSYSVSGNFKVYEFTPKSTPNYQCVYVRDADAGGLSCFPKQTKGK